MLSEDDLAKVTEFIRSHSKLYDHMTDTYTREPFASDVKAGKTSPVYNAHSYHTKVPPQGIEPFIKHYTESGELVLDPFCGSGMTGVAATRLGRVPLLIELSPIAAFISQNYCEPISPKEFDQAAKKLVEKSETLADWLYETKCRKCGKKSTIEYTILSDEFQCPRCGVAFALWDVAVNNEGEVSKEFTCPSCAKKLQKTQCKRIGLKPVRINYRCSRCGRREDRVNKFDVEKLAEIERRWKRTYQDGLRPDRNDGFWPLDSDLRALWFPSERMPEGDESRRNDKTGMTNVNHFFSTRNLWSLAWLWDQIPDLATNKISENKLRFAFTSILVISSKMGRYGKRTGNVSGTLYVPSLIKDMNVFKFLERKIWGPRGIYRAIVELSRTERRDKDFIVSVQSSTRLTNIPDCSIDYVFTDPPFGGNLMYSELNFLLESWLGRFTETRDEAIINNSQHKGIAEYKDLMTKSFREIYRVLKPSRWMTLIFHNSDGEVWQTIQDALSSVGFGVGMIGIFDKKQRSFKQVTSSGAVGYDVVINCCKPKATIKNGIEGKTTTDAIIGFLADQMLKLPLAPTGERTARMLHSKTIGFFMLQNKPLRNLSFEDFQRILRKNFRDIDDHWYLPYQRPKMQGQRRLFGYVSNEAEAIEWLEELLRSPRRYGDVAPEFFKALGPQKLQKNLQDLLQENFVEEGETWRNPTTVEKEGLIKRLTNKTAREITDYLKGTTESNPTDEEMCSWIEFCYNNGLYQEGSQLFNYIDEKRTAPEVFKRIRKVAEICKLKSREGS